MFGVEATEAGQAPFGYLQGPSADLAEQKSDFGKTRIQRWFGRDWSPV